MASSSAAQPKTPRKKRRAASEDPQLSSPATSTIFEPSPARPGRPRGYKPAKNPRQSRKDSTPAEREELRTAAKEATRVKELQHKRQKTAEAAQKKRREKELEEAIEAEEERTRKLAKALEIFENMMLPVEHGGGGFEDVADFFQTLLSENGGQAGINLTRHIKTHGKGIIEAIVERVPAVGEEFLDEKFDAKLEKVLQKEGAAIQKLLTRDWTTDVMTLLEEFTMEGLGEELVGVAPTLWRILESVTNASASTLCTLTRPQVFTSVCAMLSVSRSQKANNYQVVIGLFLLASGAAKREIEVLAHAGLSTSYNTIKDHIHKLSAEATERFQKLIKTKMCFIVWDNLNIAFRVESQRLNSANHFDNGTTATAIPVYNPDTGGDTPLGTLPLHLKPPRTTTFPILDWNCTDVLPSPISLEELTRCCLWQVKRLALQHIGNLEHLKAAFAECPEVDPIAVHLTPQFPLPAMHDDESSIEGTIRVYVQILRNLGVTNEDLRAHGLLFTDGDLLTDSLVDKVESARRNSSEPIEGMKATIRRFGLFHAKMAGCRLVVNEHWGKPNSLWPGSLWWEHHTLLKRKPLAADWKNKTATPWKPSHELLHMSVAAHVKDGFRIHCGKPDLDAWASSATMAEFDRVAEQVYRKLFTTEALDNLRSQPPALRDITHENVLLLNRDALFYIEFVSAIKKGDIGRVVNVLSCWMVMMRSPKTMPKYADAIFETLRRIDRYDPVLKRFFLHNWLVNLTGRPYSFKEVDLLQEHQNFWAKIIYNAKGSNKSWDWLSMITVCIFTLRDTMRTVQKAFKIPALGETHKIPDMSAEVQQLADALRDERIQEFVPDRPANDPNDSTAVTPVRDLLAEGAKYADAQNLGFVDAVDEGEDTIGEDGEQSETEGQDEQYEITSEDLEMDEEEPYADADALLTTATELVANVEQ
ncbi:hypothetical protein C8R43DRAFT_899453 [Mycena crocata]|nr:hypothetical protein C8R43DRAFT_899453 [Mycena crocata]